MATKNDDLRALVDEALSDTVIATAYEASQREPRPYHLVFRERIADALLAKLGPAWEALTKPPTCATCQHHRFMPECKARVIRPNNFEFQDAGGGPDTFGCTLHEPLPAAPVTEDRT